MSSPSASKSNLAPRSKASRERLLAAATDEFLAKGYAASIDDIVETAGVVRQTLYNHFENKDAIFTEVMRRLNRKVLGSLTMEGADLRTTLVRFGVILRTAVLSDAALALQRTMVAEAQRFPALARSYYLEGRDKAVRQMAALLTREAAAGRFEIPNAELAAETLLTLLVEPERSRRLLGIKPRPEPEDIAVARVVDFFLKVFQTEEQPLANGPRQPG